MLRKRERAVSGEYYLKLTLVMFSYFYSRHDHISLIRHKYCPNLLQRNLKNHSYFFIGLLPIVRLFVRVFCLLPVKAMKGIDIFPC